MATAEMDTAATAPPVVGNGSPSHWRSQAKAATATAAPPVVGRNGQWQQQQHSLPQLFVTATPNFVLSVTVNSSKQVTFTIFATTSP